MDTEGILEGYLTMARELYGNLSRDELHMKAFGISEEDLIAEVKWALEYIGVDDCEDPKILDQMLPVMRERRMSENQTDKIALAQILWDDLYSDKT